MESAGVTSSLHGALKAQAKSAARSAFESTKQRFFNHLITAMQTPSTIASIARDIDAGHAAVVQIVSTGEALQERRLRSEERRVGEEGGSTWRTRGVPYH